MAADMSTLQLEW